jgi:hypothetical protein
VRATRRPGTRCAGSTGECDVRPSQPDSGPGRIGDGTQRPQSEGRTSKTANARIAAVRVEKELSEDFGPAKGDVGPNPKNSLCGLPGGSAML